MATTMDAAELATIEAYDRWAETYPPVPHNALMRAEQQAMLALWPDGVAGARALDLACGTGRYARLLKDGGAACVVAADLSLGMLQHSRLDGRVRADMMALPFAAGAFDIVVSGLAVGHAPQLDRWMGETARVLRTGGILLYSDFHPDAARAGMERSFTDAGGRRHALAHGLFDEADHRAAAAGAGFEVRVLREVRVGRELCEGSPEFQRRWQGLAVVMVLCLCKT